MTALLTDEEIAKRGSEVVFNNDVERYRFDCGAFFARSAYEADRAKQADKIIELCAQVDGLEDRLAEDAKVRAGLMEALAEMVKCHEFGGFVELDQEVIEQSMAALAAAKEIK